MSDGFKSHIRTLWPMVLGALATMLVKTVAERFGIVIDDQFALLLVGAVTSGLIYGAGRFLENRRGSGRVSKWARGLGRLILSMGADLGRPTYKPSEPTSRHPVWSR